MKTRTAIFILLAFGVLLFAARGGMRAEAGPQPVAASDAVPVAAPGRLDRSIEFMERRVAGDPGGPTGRLWLSMLYLERARQYGDAQDVTRAEQEVGQAIHLGAANPTAYGVLASALVEQHRFVEARDVERAAVAADAANTAHRAFLAEIEMELGDYAEAGRLFTSLEASRLDLDVAPRLARWMEIHGRTEDARALLEQARVRAIHRAYMPAEQRAWFYLRIGDLDLRNGKAARAKELVSAGLQVAPGDYRLLGELARAESALGQDSAAVAAGEQVLAIRPDPAVLALLSDLHAATGDSARAQEYATVLQVLMSGSPSAFHRPEGLFLLDHGLRVPEVLAQAQDGVRTRRDIYGYDLLAWALYRSGRPAEAWQAMRSALRTGSTDAMIHYHAGMIRRALGDRAGARTHLASALEVNPHFDPLQADSARAALREVRAQAPWTERVRDLFQG